MSIRPPGDLTPRLLLAAAAATVLMTCLVEPAAPGAIRGRAAAPGATRKPAIVAPQSGAGPIVLFTGNDDGYLDACGCDDGLLGGLPRRHTLLEMLGAGGGSALVLSNGRLVAGRTAIDGNKFHAQLQSMRLMGYGAIALTDAELALGRPKLAEMAEGVLGDQCPFVATNLEDGGKEAPLPFVRSVKREVAGQTIVVLAAAASSRAALYTAADANVQVLDPAPALAAEFARLEAEGGGSDGEKAPRIVVLGQMTLEEAAELARALPRIDLLIVPGPDGKDEPAESAQRIGTTAIVTTGRKGKYVGTFALNREAGASDAYRVEVVADKYAKSEDVKEIVVAYYRDRLLDEEPRPIEAYFEQHPTKSKAAYWGADEGSCASCHPKAWEIWSKSKHAHAWKTLVDQDLPPQPGDKKDRQKNAIWDPDCVRCHVTGFGEVSGYAGIEKDSLRADAPLINVSCEACHGPAGDHAERAMNGDTAWPGPKLPKIWYPEEAAKEPARALADNAAAEKLCMQCHDPDNSPTFNLKNFWRGIVRDQQREPVAHGKE